MIENNYRTVVPPPQNSSSVVLDVFMRWFFTLHHGKAPLNHHLGEYLEQFFQAS